MEHRFDENTNTSQSHGVFLFRYGVVKKKMYHFRPGDPSSTHPRNFFFSAAGGDILLFTPPSSKVSLIEYRMIGGVLDFYFFSGPTPNSVIEQYGALIGLPTWQPVWGFGFHLCR